MASRNWRGCGTKIMVVKNNNDDIKSCIMHYTRGSTTPNGVFRAIATSEMHDHPLLVRLCYTCEKWFKRHIEFLDHVKSHGGMNAPSIGLGEWANPTGGYEPIALDRVSRMVLE